MKAGLRFAEIFEAILKYIPGSVVGSVYQRDWHSATFEGFQVTAEINLCPALPKKRISKFIADISEFDLPTNGFFVADISASRNGPEKIVIEMLVLKE